MPSPSRIQQPCSSIIQSNHRTGSAALHLRLHPRSAQLSLGSILQLHDHLIYAGSLSAYPETNILTPGQCRCFPVVHCSQVRVQRSSRKGGAARHQHELYLLQAVPDGMVVPQLSLPPDMALTPARLFPILTVACGPPALSGACSCLHQPNIAKIKRLTARVSDLAHAAKNILRIQESSTSASWIMIPISRCLARNASTYRVGKQSGHRGLSPRCTPIRRYLCK